MEVSFATQPGLPTAPNEDFIAAAPQAVVVLDGAGSPAGMESGCTHGTVWFVQQLGARLLAQLATEPRRGLGRAAAAGAAPSAPPPARLQGVVDQPVTPAA